MSRTGDRRPAVRPLAHAAAALALAGGLTFGLPALLASTPVGTLHGSVATAVEGGARLDRTSPPVRVRMRALGIDLPVVSSSRNVRANPPDYPLCDVAEYWTIHDVPGRPGTAWIYAHAQPGMFLPLIDRANTNGDSSLLGLDMEIQLRDGRLLTYRIDKVKRSNNQSIAKGTPKGEHRLVMHTSTGPPGTIPKLQVAGDLVSARRTNAKAPKPQPRPCSQPARNGNQNGSSTNGNGGQDPTIAEPQDETDPMTLALAAGAVLLGATLVAVVLIRK